MAYFGQYLGVGTGPFRPLLRAAGSLFKSGVAPFQRSPNTKIAAQTTPEYSSLSIAHKYKFCINIWGYCLDGSSFRYGANSVTYAWVDCDQSAVSQRYDQIAGLIPFFEKLLFLPRGLRRKAVDCLMLKLGDRVLEVGCGTGRNFPYLYAAVGRPGYIYGVDLSAGMLRKADMMRNRNGWNNISLTQGDAAGFSAPEQLDGVFFSLSYNTMPHHLKVLHQSWKQLRRGGRLVIMDAKLPPGPCGRLILPFSLWLMKRTMLGNPYIQPWEDLKQFAAEFDMEEFLFGSYYICHVIKP